MSNVLDEIVAYKRQEIDEAKRVCPAEMLEDRLAAAPAVRDFVGSLANPPRLDGSSGNGNGNGIGLIAEVKKASPSAGLIRDDFDPVAIARIYEEHGAACISCLTDEHFFQGHLDFLCQIRPSVAIPILRKDFILDRYQVLEARVAGADCVLLIAECLDDCTMRDLYFYASELGMDALIEIYELENLDRVLKLDPPLLGINNRNLKTFVTELDHSIQLSQRVPDSTLLVSESGIRDQADVARLQQAGIAAILVGETLMRPADIGAKVDEILGR